MRRALSRLATTPSENSAGRPRPARAAQARRHAAWLAPLALAAGLLLAGPGARAQASDTTLAQPAAGLNSTVLEAREAARRKDRARLLAARAALQAAGHPLTPWAEYWELGARLQEATVDEVEAFYARWPGSYVEDRLRNDWLLELGRRRDFNALARDYPRFRMNDDRDVSCWALLTDHLAGRDVADAARTAWFNQREADDGCNMLATAMVDAKRFNADDVWRKARLAVEGQRPGAARQAIGLLGSGGLADASEALDNPARFLRRSAGISRTAHELRLLALMRLVAADSEVSTATLEGHTTALPRALQAWAWAYAARQSAFRLQPDAVVQVQRAWAAVRADDRKGPGFSDETLAWGVRAVLRATPSAARWALVLRQIDAMSATEQREPAWVYWKARALLATAAEGADGEAQRAEARHLQEGLAGAVGFYPQLAADDLGLKPTLPATPPALTPAEREAAQRHPGLRRAMLLTSIGLRDEARREWNYSLRGLDDRALMAAARLACDASDWQLCINTADRTRSEIDLALRYPTPYAAEISQAALAAGLEPALVFGLIRQETRFMAQLRSHVGATGLMQVMPNTGKLVARKIGLEPFRPESLGETATNLKLGTAYLKMVLDDLGGSQAMAAAAYNAGPGRPRRWREGNVLDAAAWAETIPFNETRDYVKKVLSNAAIYAALLDARRPAPALRPRLGSTIGPRDANAPAANTELP